MDIVYKNKKVDKVFWAVDIYAFIQPPDQTRFPLPTYSYNDNILNDIEYVLNKDVIIRDFKVLENINKGIPNTNFDDAYQWYPRFINDFAAEKVAKKYSDSRQDILAALPKDEYIELAIQNMENNILPIIKNDADTEFYLFFPPYSILFWDSINRIGELDAYLYIEEYIVETLLQYDNVRIYNFQSDEQIVCELTEYKDDTHYSPEISSLIVTNLSTQDYLLTQENYIEKIDDIKGLIINTDVDALLNSYISMDDELN